MASTYQSGLDCVSVANQTFADVFNDGPYTSLKMVEYLMLKCRVSYLQYVTDPRILTQVSPEAIAKDNMDDGQLSYTWVSRTGRCTSFALKVTALLERMYPGYFEFMFYDLSGHRVARCRRTGIVIDSSSVLGAFQLRRGEWFRNEGMNASWKWIDGTSKFERQHERDGKTKTVKKISTETISPIRAMSICLTDVAAKAAAHTLFRSFENGQTNYFGFINWDFKHKRLELVRTVKESREDKTNKIIVAWGRGGSPADHATCALFLQNFVQDYGGPLGQEQWAADGIERINVKIWSSANAAWGFPVLVTP